MSFVFIIWQLRVHLKECFLCFFKKFTCIKKLSNPLCVTFQVFISAALMEYFCSKVSHTVWLLVILWLNVNFETEKSNRLMCTGLINNYVHDHHFLGQSCCI